MKQDTVSRKILEVFGLLPHPEAREPEDPELPILWVDRTDDMWVMNIYRAGKLDATDRSFIWAQFAEAAQTVLGAKYPGIFLRITPPGEYPNGTPAEGFVQYQYPPPNSRLAANHWFEVMSDELPEINNLLARRLEKGWFEYLCAKHSHAGQSASARRDAQLRAIDNARERNSRRGPDAPPRRMKL